MTTKSVDEIAEQIARNAHQSQKRKFGDDEGKPYIIHPQRIANKFDCSVDKAIAWLHDVAEDTKITIEDLRELNVFSKEIIDAVDALTKREGEDYLDFILRIKKNDLAIPIKIADIEDNLKSLKIGSLRDKYLMALHILREKVVVLPPPPPKDIRRIRESDDKPRKPR